MEQDGGTVAMTKPLLDTSVIDRLSLDVGADTTKMLLESLKNEIEQSGQKIMDHLSNKDCRLLEIQAHALKSAARSFGALQLGESCLALEEAARASDFQTLERLIKDFKNISAATLHEYGFKETA